MERKRRKKADPSVIRTRKHHFYLTVGAGTLLVLGLVINLFVPSRTFSENENRSLAQRPALTLSALTDGSFAQGFSDYYADQFAARDGWTSLNYRLSRLLGQKDFSTVYAGKDGYLLGTPETPDETALARTIAAVNDFAAAYPDVEMNLMAVPDAAATLADKLPKHAPVRDQRSDLAALYQRMEGVGTIDAAAVLSAHASEDIYYKTDNSDKLQDEIEVQLNEMNYNLNNIDESFRQMNNLYTLIGIFLYGFIIVISLIGVTNIFNTITTNMELRKPEFAMLRSVGMTNREFNRMIRLESLFMGTRALVFGIPIGILLSYAIYHFLMEESGDPYKLPALAILIAVAAVFVLISLIMAYSMGKIKKQNTIETIRNENI